MAETILPDIAELRNRIDYDPESGELTWKERRESDFRTVGKISASTRAKQWNNRFCGKRAFATPAPNGYLVGSYGIGLTLLAHRVAFAIREGRWPSKIDHRNGDRTDNRWSNIHEVSDRQNAMNCRVRSDSSTGRTGVRRRKSGMPYAAIIKANGKDLYLGAFRSFEEAVAAREGAEKVLGYSRRHGKSL